MKKLSTSVIMLMAVVVFTGGHALVKSVEGIPISQIVFIRAIISAIICVGLVKTTRLDARGKNKPLLIARAVLGVIAFSMFFYTLQHLPLGTATTITHIEPIFLILASAVILKEGFHPLQLVFFMLAFVGVFIIKGTDGRISAFDLTISIMTVFFSGLSHVLLRKLKDFDHPYVILLWFSVIIIICTGYFAIQDWVWPTNYEWLRLAAMSVLMTLGQIFMSFAYHREKLANVSIFHFLAVVFAFSYGYFVFGESYEWEALIGIVVIIFCVVLNTLFANSLKRKKGSSK